MFEAYNLGNDNKNNVNNSINPSFAISDIELFIYQCILSASLINAALQKDLLSYLKNQIVLLFNTGFVFITVLQQHKVIFHIALEFLNYVEQGSACECGISNYFFILYHTNGKMKFSSLNMSKNVHLLMLH